jgi:hypothetical protein
MYAYSCPLVRAAAGAFVLFPRHEAFEIELRCLRHAVVLSQSEMKGQGAQIRATGRS